MQEIIFPCHGESSKKMDMKIFCKMLTAAPMNSSNSKRVGQADHSEASPADEDPQLRQLMTHHGRLHSTWSDL